MDASLGFMGSRPEYEWGRAERLEAIIKDYHAETFEESPFLDKQLVVTEIRKETIVCERMLVVDIDIYEEDIDLHLLPGLYGTPRRDNDGTQQAMPQNELLSQPTPLPLAPEQYQGFHTYA
jgi:hypothetical protein